MPLRRLPCLGLPVDPPPAAHNALHVGGRARAAHGEQPGLGLRHGHAGEGAHLGVRELSATQGLGEARQRAEGAGYPYALPRGAQIQAYAPGEPGGAGAEARVPPAAGIELADQVEETGSGGIEVGGQLGNLIAEAIQLLVVGRRRVSMHGESSFYWSDSTPRILGLQERPERNDLGARKDFSLRRTSSEPREPARSAKVVLAGGWHFIYKLPGQSCQAQIVDHLCIDPHALTPATWTDRIGSPP